MTPRIETPDLVALAAQRTNRDAALVEEITDAVLEEIVAARTRGESVSPHNVGSFYVRWQDGSMSQEDTALAPSIEQVYPHLTEWVQTHGWIEIGQGASGRSFVRALDEGGLFWEGRASYATLGDALQALDTALKGWRSGGPEE